MRSVLLRGLFFPAERYVVAKRRNNDGIPRDSWGKRAKPRREQTDRRAIDREISTDYNGKLSASRDAFFFTIDFAHRRREDREYESNDGARREKCSGLPKLHAHTVKLVGNLRNSTGGWYPSCGDNAAYTQSGLANPWTSLSRQRLIILIMSFYITRQPLTIHESLLWYEYINTR